MGRKRAAKRGQDRNGCARALSFYRLWPATLLKRTGRHLPPPGLVQQGGDGGHSTAQPPPVAVHTRATSRASPSNRCRASRPLPGKRCKIERHGNPPKRSARMRDWCRPAPTGRNRARRRNRAGRNARCSCGHPHQGRQGIGEIRDRGQDNLCAGHTAASSRFLRSERIKARTLSSVSGQTRPPSSRRATNSLLEAAFFPKYDAPMLVSARKAWISSKRF